MSTPRSGVVEVFAGTPGLGDVVQGSGILIAPDAILTAAHVVESTAGLRSMVTAAAGVGGAPPYASSFAAATVHVDPGFVPSANGTSSGSVASHDFAVIHLAQPMSGTVYALGTSAGGTLTVGGYPVGTGSTYDEATESFATNAADPGLFSAKVLGEGGDPHGSSGGPVMDLSGIPAVVGLVEGADSTTGVGAFVQLTAADIAEIGSWMAVDHGAAVVAAAPTAAATTSPAPQPAPAIQLPPPPQPAPASEPAPSALAMLAAAIAGAAAGAPTAARQTAMSDVSDALASAAASGDADLGGGWSDAAARLRAASSAPRRALGYLGGLVAALDGTGRGDAVGTAASLFPALPFDGSHPVLCGLARAGWSEMNALSSTQTAAAASVADLAASITTPSAAGGAAFPAAWMPSVHHGSTLVASAHGPWG